MTAANVRRALDWHLRTPFFYGWLIVGMAILAGYGASGASQLVLGALQVYIFEDLGWSRSTFALPITLGTWSAALLTPLAGRLADKHGPRWLMPLGAVTAGIVFFALSGMTAVWHFYSSFIIGRALISPTMGGVVSSTAVVNWFHEKRNTALGFVSMAHPLGASLNIQVLQFLSTNFGWRFAYRCLGAFSLVLTAGLFLFMRRRPEDLGMKPDGVDPAAPTERGVSGLSISGSGASNDWDVSAAVRTAPFWLVTITLTLATVAISSINFHMVPYLREKGVPVEFATSSLALSAFLGAVANTGWGWLSDRFTARRCEIAALLFAAVMVVFLLNIEGIGMALLFAALWGIASRGEGILGQMIIAQFYGRRSFGSIIGVMAPLQTAALGSGPLLAAFVRDAAGSYYPLYVVFAITYALSAILIYLARTPQRATAAAG